MASMREIQDRQERITRETREPVEARRPHTNWPGGKGASVELGYVVEVVEADTEEKPPHLRVQRFEYWSKTKPRRGAFRKIGDVIDAFPLEGSGVESFKPFIYSKTVIFGEAAMAQDVYPVLLLQRGAYFAFLPLIPVPSVLAPGEAIPEANWA